MIDFIFLEHNSSSSKLCLLAGVLAPYGEVHTSSINLVMKIYDTSNGTMNGSDCYLEEYDHKHQLQRTVLADTGKHMSEMRSCDLFLWAMRKVPNSLLTKISKFNPDQGRKFTAFGHEYDLCFLIDTAKDELEERREDREKQN